MVETLLHMRGVGRPASVLFLLSAEPYCDPTFIYLLNM